MSEGGWQCVIENENPPSRSGGKNEKCFLAVRMVVRSNIFEVLLAVRMVVRSNIFEVVLAVRMVVRSNIFEFVLLSAWWYVRTFLKFVSCLHGGTFEHF